MLAEVAVEKPRDGERVPRSAINRGFRQTEFEVRGHLDAEFSAAEKWLGMQVLAVLP